MEDDYFILETDIIEYETTKRVTEKVMAEDQLAVIRKLYSKLKDVDRVADLLDLQADVVAAAVADGSEEVQANQTVGQKG